MSMRTTRHAFWRACLQQARRVPELRARLLRLMLGGAVGIDIAVGLPLWPTLMLLVAIIAVLTLGIRARRGDLDRGLDP